jgi:DNA-binding NtrC family response regulator
MVRKKKVSVVITDTEKRFRVTTTAALRNCGFDVSAVSNAAEEIREIKETDADVAVLDMKMQGNEALREMKTIKPEIEVVILLPDIVSARH